MKTRTFVNLLNGKETYSNDMTFTSEYKGDDKWTFRNSDYPILKWQVD